MPDVGTKAKARTPAWRIQKTTDYKFCYSNILTPEQRSLLATPTYKIKKEKHEAKKLESELSSTPSKDNVLSPNPSLVDPASVSVIGAVDDQGKLQSPGFGEPAGKQKKKDKATTSEAMFTLRQTCQICYSQQAGQRFYRHQTCRT